MMTSGYVRRATKADRDGILSIIPSGEYDGDYLHDYFDMLMDDPLYDAFVYVIGDQVIGLAAISIIDGGIAGALRSGRVRKEYQGRGIITKIEHELYRNYPMIKYMTTASMSRLKELYDLINSGRTKLMATRKCVFYSGSIERLPTVAENNGAQIIHKHDLQKIFREQKQYPRVFVDERLVIDSILYRIMESNVPIILTEKTRAIVSSIDNPDQTLLTFGSCFRQPTGELFCKIDVYGVIGESLTSHILLHIKIGIDTVKQFNDGFTVEIRPKAHDENIERLMSSIGLTNGSVGRSRRTDVVCTEFVNPVFSQL